MFNKNNQNNYLDLADTVRSERLARGLSQRQLSNILSMSPAYTSHLESGRIQPTTQTLRKISYSLKLSYNRLAFLAGYTDIDSTDNAYIGKLNRLSNFTDSEWESILDYAKYLLTRRKKPESSS